MADDRSDTSPSTEDSSVEDQKLAEALRRQGVLTEDQLELARQHQREKGVSLWRALISLNLVDAQQLATAMSGRPMEGPAPAAEPRPDAVEARSSIGEELGKVAQTATAAELVTRLFETGFDLRATDLHFDPQEDEYRIRFRIDGMLHDTVSITLELAQSVLSRIKILANMNIIERRAAQDGHINMPRGDHFRDLRVATVPTSLGERLVVRILDTASVLTGMDQLGLEPDQVEAMWRLTDRPYGLVLVAGPVGSGKTTTLYSGLHRVNKPTKNVMTIEDPVEYRLAGVNQLQVETRTNFTFVAGLRALMRQDPDVIMVGEIRDDETAHIATRASLTGVLVFSSIHANEATATVGNLYNYQIPGFLISSALQGVVAQRLVRKICPYCKTAYTPEAPVRRDLGLKADDEDLVLYRGRGCNACFQTGFLGRTGIFEVIEVGEELRDMIFRQTTKEVIRQVAIDLGMQTLKQSAINKVRDGTTTVEEMYRVVSM